MFLLVLGAIACLFTAATSTQLFASDPAGNGLAQVFYVAMLCALWLLVGALLFFATWVPPPNAAARGLPWGTVGSVAALSFVVAVVTHGVMLSWLFDAANRGFARTAVLTACGLLPVPFLGFAAWRFGVLPLPTSFATRGCLSLALVAVVAALGVRSLSSPKRTRGDAFTAANLAFPVLFVDGERSVEACHHVESARERLVNGGLTSGSFVVDANCTSWSIVSAPNGGVTFERRSTALEFEELRAAILRIPRLHDDAARDAELRHLVAMQKTVSALAFVLPH